LVWAAARNGEDLLTFPRSQKGTMQFLDRLLQWIGCFSYSTMNRSLFLGLAAAAATSGSVFFQAPAQAGCLTSSAGTNCLTFNQSSASSVIDRAFTDSDFIANTQLDDIRFYQNGFTGGLPITLTNIAYSIDGGANWSTTNLSSTSYTISSTFTDETNSTNLLTSSVVAAQNNIQLRFTIPTTPTLAPAGRRIVSFLANSGTSPQTQSRTHTLADIPPSVPTPGPLPLLGAGAAFGFSRRLRSRLRTAA
jgi:hypothetical protein